MTAKPYTITEAFHLLADGVDLAASVTHETATGRLVAIHVCDKRSGELIQIPPYAFDALVEAVNAKKEF